jgi:hypothetical protein
MKNEKNLLKFDNNEFSYAIYNHNLDYIDSLNLKLDFSIKNNYALLFCYFPFSDKQDKLFKKLKDKDKAGYLFRYLLKIAKIVKVPEVLIRNCFDSNTKRRKKFVTYQNFNDDIIKDFQNDNFSNIKKMYENYSSNYENKIIFIHNMKLVFGVIFSIISETNERKMKIEKIFDI